MSPDHQSASKEFGPSTHNLLFLGGGNLGGDRQVRGAIVGFGFPFEEANTAADLRILRPTGDFSLIIFMESADPSLLNAATSSSRFSALPVILVRTGQARPSATLESLDRFDDWVASEAIESDFLPRIQRLLSRRPASERDVEVRSPLTIDSDFFSLVVHDLRTPLNVIYLTLLMIRQAVPKDDVQLDQDLKLVEDNFRQMERMLTQLTDYHRLFEHDLELSPSEFSPRRMVDELLEARTMKAGVKSLPVAVEVRESCPEDVSLDPIRARLALTYTLSNATAAAGSHEIRFVMRGDSQHWVIELAIDHPAPQSVKSSVLSSRKFERLCGFAPERRGMDLAIAARVTELFGGTARLDVIAEQGTVVVLEWPRRLRAGST